MLHVRHHGSEHPGGFLILLVLTCPRGDSLQRTCGYEAGLCCGVEVGGAKPGYSEGDLAGGEGGGGNQRKDLPKKAELTFKGKTTAS